jgi:CDP-diacylglycerol--glycerol-3-phosphate 3-phosphatidyltransferase
MPNLITMARIFLVVPFAAMFFIDAAWAMTAALVIFAIAAFTDFLDGWLARKTGKTSALGAALDPIADKLLVAAALVLLVRNGVVREWGVIAALIIILRELFVAGLREALAARGHSLPVSALAKWKTTFQIVAIGFLLASAPGGFAGEGIRPVASGLFWVAAILTFWTGADYAFRAARALAK